MTNAHTRSPYRALIALGLVAGLGLLYGWNMVFLAPQGRQRTEVQGKLASARKQGDDLRAQLAQLKKVAADTQSREAELARLGRLVPAEPDVAGAILTLNDTANLAQVAMSSFVPAPAAPSAGGGPVTMGISMKISGTFPQVFDYLVDITAAAHEKPQPPSSRSPPPRCARSPFPRFAGEERGAPTARPSPRACRAAA